MKSYSTNFILISMLLLLLISRARAQTLIKPWEAFNGGIGVQAPLMGNAFVGLAEDGSAIYWNPAAMASRYGSRATISGFLPPVETFTTVMFSGVSHSFINPINDSFSRYLWGKLVLIATPVLLNTPPIDFELGYLVYYIPALIGILSTSGAGIGFSHISLPLSVGFPLKGVPATLSSISQNTIHFATSWEVSPHLFVGYGGKLIMHSDHVSTLESPLRSFAYGSDLGVLISVPFMKRFVKKIGIGLNLQNAIAPKFVLANSHVKWPTNLKAGIGFRISNRKETTDLAVAVDGNWNREQPLHINLGISLNIRSAFNIGHGRDYRGEYWGMAYNFFRPDDSNEKPLLEGMQLSLAFYGLRDTISVSSVGAYVSGEYVLSNLPKEPVKRMKAVFILTKKELIQEEWNRISMNEQCGEYEEAKQNVHRIIRLKRQKDKQFIRRQLIGLTDSDMKRIIRGRFESISATFISQVEFTSQDDVERTKEDELNQKIYQLGEVRRQAKSADEYLHIGEYDVAIKQYDYCLSIIKEKLTTSLVDYESIKSKKAMAIEGKNRAMIQRDSIRVVSVASEVISRKFEAESLISENKLKDALSRLWAANATLQVCDSLYTITTARNTLALGQKILNLKANVGFLLANIQYEFDADSLANCSDDQKTLFTALESYARVKHDNTSWQRRIEGKKSNTQLEMTGTIYMKTQKWNEALRDFGKINLDYCSGQIKNRIIKKIKKCETLEGEREF